MTLTQKGISKTDKVSVDHFVEFWGLELHHFNDFWRQIYSPKKGNLWKHDKQKQNKNKSSFNVSSWLHKLQRFLDFWIPKQQADLISQERSNAKYVCRIGQVDYFQLDFSFNKKKLVKKDSTSFLFLDTRAGYE